MIAARQQTGSSGCTIRTHVEFLQLHSSFRNRIEMRSIDQFISVNAYVAISLIIGHDKKNIGMISRKNSRSNDQ